LCRPKYLTASAPVAAPILGSRDREYSRRKFYRRLVSTTKTVYCGFGSSSGGSVPCRSSSLPGKVVPRVDLVKSLFSHDSHSIRQCTAGDTGFSYEAT
jgi:hypothetical protein